MTHHLTGYRMLKEFTNNCLFELFIVIENKHIQSIQVYIVFRQVLVHNDNSKVKTNDRRTVQIGNLLLLLTVTLKMQMTLLAVVRSNQCLT